MSKKARTIEIVAFGFSSMIQWPEPGMIPSRTLLAANCMIFAIVAPNDFSPPIPSTGMESLPLARNCWLSTASCRAHYFAWVDASDTTFTPDFARLDETGSSTASTMHRQRRRSPGLQAPDDRDACLELIWVISRPRRRTQRA
jgi:hypothetical protein